MNAGLFPTTAGKVTTFVVRDPGATADRTVVITSTNLSPKPVNRTAVIPTASGNVGYILFNTFSPFASEREIVDAITTMQSQNVNDLILDLRYNGGGAFDGCLPIELHGGRGGTDKWTGFRTAAVQ